MHASDLLCFLCPRPKKPSAADAVPRGLPSLSHPSPNVCTSQPGSTGHIFTNRAQDGTANQFAHESLILAHSSPTPTPGPSGSIVGLPTYPPKQTNLGSSGGDTLLAVPHQLHDPVPVVTSQEFVRPADQNIRSISYNVQNSHDSRNVYIDGNMNTVTYTNTIINSPDNFMKELLKETIPGAEFDSSARDPPPRCHPGTRLAILERCIHFIVNCSGKRKMRWLVGTAGVGKSAIMQSVAESPPSSVTLRASIFFFVNGRNDGSKAIVTLAYQLAVQCELYRQFIKDEIAHDPSLLQKSLSVQFEKFVVQPFIHHLQLNSAARILILLDGLDECEQSRTQRELLQLISNCCITYPASPIVWMIASRPEPHIITFFTQASVEAVYEKEEIPVDSDEARADVEKFLREELKKIQNEFSLNSWAQWPPEPDFWKVANAAGGLFVYAHTVTKYIGDPNVGDPMSQLQIVLRIINTHSLSDIPREDHPMTLLDALYSRILSTVPTKVKANMQKLLLALAEGPCLLANFQVENFIVLCNWLGMTPDEAYAALRHLSSVLTFPGRDKAHNEPLRSFHKSFMDFISDFSRSGFLRDFANEARQLYNQCAIRVLEQAPDGIDIGRASYKFRGFPDLGTMARGPGHGENISLTWQVGRGGDWGDSRTRLQMYKMAIATVVNGIVSKMQPFYDVFHIRFLVTRFESLGFFTTRVLRQFAFDPSHRHEFLQQGLLQQIPVMRLEFRRIVKGTELQFRRPACKERNVSNPWNTSCEHSRSGKWEEDQDQTWSTTFYTHWRTVSDCKFCNDRLERQLKQYQTLFPDHLVAVLFTSSGEGLVEFQFVDLEDDVSEWTYLLQHDFSEEERRMLGSPV